jgi:ABC-type branched-subunit amino acid transport system ATPase component
MGGEGERVEATPLLETEGITAGYVRGIDILTNISVHVEPGEIVTVVGANGAGKSTLLKVVFGLLRPRTGQVRVSGERIDGFAPHEIVQKGLGYVPQLENVFPSLSVDDNLEMSSGTMRGPAAKARREELYELFPTLLTDHRKSAGLLSGGQRQMVAMARALMPSPRVLLLDEPSAGLAPKFVEVVFETIVAIRNAGVAVLLVEQNARRALAFSDRGYVLEVGRNRFEGAAHELLNSELVIELYLGRRRVATVREVNGPAATTIGGTA